MDLEFKRSFMHSSSRTKLMLLGDALKLLISGFDRVEEVVVFWREGGQDLRSRSAVKMAGGN